MLNEMDSTPHIKCLRVYLTRKYLKTYGLLCLRKRIKRVYRGINAAVIGLERFGEQMKTL